MRLHDLPLHPQLLTLHQGSTCLDCACIRHSAVICIPGVSAPCTYSGTHAANALLRRLLASVGAWENVTQGQPHE